MNSQKQIRRYLEISCDSIRHKRTGLVTSLHHHERSDAYQDSNHAPQYTHAMKSGVSDPLSKILLIIILKTWHLNWTC